MVPEEHSHRAPKRLIFTANRQWNITDTISSTNTSSGKGWIYPEGREITLLDSRVQPHGQRAAPTRTCSGLNEWPN